MVTLSTKNDVTIAETFKFLEKVRDVFNMELVSAAITDNDDESSHNLRGSANFEALLENADSKNLCKPIGKVLQKFLDQWNDDP